jgi:hypothetical protein
MLGTIFIKNIKKQFIFYFTSTIKTKKNEGNNKFRKELNPYKINPFIAQ